VEERWKERWKEIRREKMKINEGDRNPPKESNFRLKLTYIDFMSSVLLGDIFL